LRFPGRLAVHADVGRPAAKDRGDFGTALDDGVPELGGERELAIGVILRLIVTAPFGHRIKTSPIAVCTAWAGASSAPGPMTTVRCWPI
jgi:hypothetical protein